MKHWLASKVSIVVVPRERFSIARRSLEHLIENTHAGFEMVYVDGGSPPRASAGESGGACTAAAHSNLNAIRAYSFVC